MTVHHSMTYRIFHGVLHHGMFPTFLLYVSTSTAIRSTLTTSQGTNGLQRRRQSQVELHNAMHEYASIVKDSDTPGKLTRFYPSNPKVTVLLSEACVT